MKLLDKLFSLLPFNGDKTKIGAILSLLPILKILFPALGALLDPIIQILNPEITGPIVLGTGVAHKAVKRAS